MLVFRVRIGPPPRERDRDRVRLLFLPSRFPALFHPSLYGLELVLFFGLLAISSICGGFFFFGGRDGVGVCFRLRGRKGSFDFSSGPRREIFHGGFFLNNVFDF